MHVAGLRENAGACAKGGALGEGSTFGGEGIGGARVRAFAAADSTSGLARLPDRLPPVYGLAYVLRFPFRAPMLRSVSPCSPGSRHIGARFTPIFTAVSGHEC